MQSFRGIGLNVGSQFLKSCSIQNNLFKNFSAFVPSYNRKFGSSSSSSSSSSSGELPIMHDVGREHKWADFRPNLVEVEVTRNSDGDLIGQWEGEECIFPEQEPTLEWVLSTPVDLHLFEEVPIVKECYEAEEIEAMKKHYDKELADAKLAAKQAAQKQH